MTKCQGNFITCDDNKHTCPVKDVCYSMISTSIKDGVDTRISFQPVGDMNYAPRRKSKNGHDGNPKK